MCPAFADARQGLKDYWALHICSSSLSKICVAETKRTVVHKINPRKGLADVDSSLSDLLRTRVNVTFHTLLIYAPPHIKV